jgi:hypothetical protein
VHQKNEKYFEVNITKKRTFVNTEMSCIVPYKKLKKLIKNMSANDTIKIKLMEER